MVDLSEVIDRIESARHTAARSRAVLVALSGIDGSGKGYVTRILADALEGKGYRVAAINIDGWLNLPEVRFDEADPAGHFYRQAIRFNDLFSQLALPLRDSRSVDVEVDHAEETATTYTSRRYSFEEVDIVILEGIYLLKRSFLEHYDLAVWIDCSFETALERAIARAQEGLPPAETVRAYQRVYFPAQEIHYRLDRPAEAADVVLVNDDRYVATP